MLKFSVSSLIAISLLSGCVSGDKPSYPYKGKVSIAEKSVCIHADDLAKGDMYTGYLIYEINSKSEDRAMKHEISPAYGHCLPNRTYISGKKYAAIFMVMTPSGAVKRYSVDFTFP
ncbi:putative T6SS immunity periplasmic lipoprotein [Citrobacter sp. wls619]|uniref:putative T6SS immunity periplasmic lipoprotein n=1 Tax=Citrobacter sp. wls619 TaxID=2576432 RepID=UPI0034CD1F85